MDKPDITRLLQRINDGDRDAYGKLLQSIYQELRNMAGRRMSLEAPGHTLQPTALVNETCIRLLESDTAWANRRHFFAAAAEAMRRVLVDHARRRRADKRGRGTERVTLTNFDIPQAQTDVDLIAVEETLTQLERENPRLAQIVELRFFVGLEIEDTARVLGVSPATVKRDWAFARAWILDRLSLEEGT